ncbi:hypothetical protein STBA_71510 [Streptomyces sp. MP131-18]|nr:hypothetical protein STBA_71510 [Streptomyces sp. MP131-18]
MRGDGRQIQTAVLGSAGSEEPLMLPLEAIELETFRRRYERDTFWCGLLLGGCGGELTTKLYTDRVCHFAHHPGPDGMARECGRRARGVSSADHLYVKSAAASWFRDKGERVDIGFAGQDGVPIGSVVDILSPRGVLRVHLDRATPPVWDQDGSEPVLGVAIPVDSETLIRRWYVHRIRLDSEGAARRVRIGTEAFARPTEWFALDDCEMTDRGLSTPAVERIVRERTTRPARAWPAKKPRKGPDPQGRARFLLRQLADARKVEAVVVVTRVCRDIAAVTGLDAELKEQLTAAVADAQDWLGQQAEVRRDLFSRLADAVAGGQTKEARVLLIRVNATASHDRTEEEDDIVGTAADYLDAVASAAADRVKALLSDLRRRRRFDMSATELRLLVQEIIQAAAQAGELLGTYEKSQIAAWTARMGLGTPTPTSARAPAASAPAGRRTQRRPLHAQVARRHWYKSSCPRCQAGKGENCVIDDEARTGEVRNVPHNERLQLIVDERKAQQKRTRPWRVYEVTCPDCGQGDGERCRTPGGPHRSRVERAKTFTQLKKPRPEAMA